MTTTDKKEGAVIGPLFLGGRQLTETPCQAETDWKGFATSMPTAIMALVFRVVSELMGLRTSVAGATVPGGAPRGTGNRGRPCQS